MTPLDSVIHPKTLVQGGVKKVLAIKRMGLPEDVVSHGIVPKSEH